MCFRRVGPAVVGYYRDNYDTYYAAESKAYLRRAAECGSSSGDTAEMPESLFPQQLWNVAQHELGFVSGQGETMPSRGVVVHGFASIISSNAEPTGSFIEYVSAFSGNAAPISQTKPDFSTLSWELETDPVSDFEDEINTRMRQQGAPAFVDYTVFDLTSSIPAGHSLMERWEIIAEFVEQIEDSLSDNDFFELSDREIRETLGMSAQEFRRQFASQLPAQIRQGRVARLSDEIVISMNEYEDCSDYRDSIFVSLISTMLPVERSRPTEYGGIMLAVMGVGACSQGRSNRRLIQDATDEAIEDIEAYIRSDDFFDLLDEYDD